MDKQTIDMNAAQLFFAAISGAKKGDVDPFVSNVHIVFNNAVVASNEAHSVIRFDPETGKRLDSGGNVHIELETGMVVKKDYDFPDSTDAGLDELVKIAQKLYEERCTDKFSTAPIIVVYNNRTILLYINYMTKHIENQSYLSPRLVIDHDVPGDYLLNNIDEARVLLNQWLPDGHEFSNIQ